MELVDSPENRLLKHERSNAFGEEWEKIKVKFNEDEDAGLVIMAIEQEILEKHKCYLDRQAICDETGFDMKKVNAIVAKIGYHMKSSYLELKKRMS